ncbi:MAG: AAA family ATPase [Bacteroidaceae bacterium]|nr:AAA family ATPase [Bacteroidaceae bacterium]
MRGIKNIEISNFRGIEHLKIDDMARVNVLLGQNNSGKSTVLESIAMLMSMSNPDAPQLLNSSRTRKPFSNFIDIKYFFRNLDVSLAPQLNATHSDSTGRSLRMGLTYVFDEKAEPDKEPIQQTGSAVRYVNTLELNFDVKKNNSIQSYKCWLRVNPSGMVVNRKYADGYLEQDRAFLISADLMSSNLVNDLTELFKRNNKDSVLALLKLFDSRINGIEILKDDVYIGFEGLSEMLPSGMAGDGLRRYLNIVAAAANPLNNMILIDEIDNGIHYSAYTKLWSAIFALALNTDKQIFVTTHSQETLNSLNYVLENAAQYQDELRLYTLESTRLKGLQAYKYTYQGLKDACENNIELRSIVQ